MIETFLSKLLFAIFKKFSRVKKYLTARGNEKKRAQETKKRKKIGRTIGTKQEQNEEKVMVRQVSEMEKRQRRNG